MISDDYPNIRQLLLLMIIMNSRNWTISINVKENIMVNRQNQLIANPYHTHTCTHATTAGYLLLVSNLNSL